MRGTPIEKQKTYGLAHKPFYMAWRNMVQRCTDKNHPNAKNYVSRGITICDRWLLFENFIEDMYELYEYHVENFGGGRKDCQLDRIDNNKGYYKDNCRWVTAKINQNNRREYKRIGNPKYIEFNGKKQSIKDWSKEYSINYYTLVYRIKHWGIKEALTKK